MVRFLLVVVSCLVILFSGCTSSTATKSTLKTQVSPPPQTQSAEVTAVVLDSSQIFEIYSPTNKQKYRIRVRLPGSYQTNLTKNYPMMIKLDGQWDFLLAASAFNCIYFDGQMPETIFVGIDWADVEGDVHALRSRDLLPAPISRYAGSGHAKTYIDVIVKEIIPELNNRFRLNGHQYLLGGSWGGTFATYALLEQPSAFDGAIAIAGDYDIAGDVFKNQIQSLKGSTALNGKRLYIGIGKWDSVAPTVLEYAKNLKQAKLAGFDLKVDSLDGFGHSGMNIPGYAGGYQHMFARPKLVLAAEKLKRFIGTYQATDNKTDTLIIAASSEGLTVTLPGEHAMTLLAKSENSFYHPGIFYNLTFDETQVQLETFFGNTKYQKISVEPSKKSN